MKNEAYTALNKNVIFFSPADPADLLFVCENLRDLREKYLMVYLTGRTEFWLNAQVRYDLEKERENNDNYKSIALFEKA